MRRRPTGASLQSALGDIDSRDTGWVVGRLPPGFTKIVEGYRLLRDRREPVVHLVYSDGLVAVSVFIEKTETTRPRPVGHSHQGSINVFVRPVDDRRRDRAGRSAQRDGPPDRQFGGPPLTSIFHAVAATFVRNSAKRKST